MQALRKVTGAGTLALTCRMRLAVRGGVGQAGQAGRWLSSEAMSVPTVDGEPKVYPEKLHTIVSEISKLTLLEVSDLNALLKHTLKIPDAPVMAFGAPAGQTVKEEEEEEEEAAPAKVQTSFTLKMNKYDETKKVALIKEVKAKLEGYNLVQAKKFVESCPCVVKADIPKDEAEALMEAFKAVGAECVIE